jgi:hypothetical protein
MCNTCAQPSCISNSIRMTMNNQPNQGSPRFIELLEEAKRIHIAKNAGYSGVGATDPWKNFREAERFGITPLKGCLVRMSDKFIRVSNLIQDPEADQVGEKITDTLIDLANYCLIAVCLYEEEQELSDARKCTMPA